MASKLSEQEREVIEECGTERPFTSDLLEIDEDGVFKCKKCGNVLFSSEAKFKSGTGWPSFWDTANSESVEKQPDGRRTEVLCSECGGHLGHVFDDGPEKHTGKRYCINGVALEFEAEDE